MICYNLFESFYFISTLNSAGVSVNLVLIMSCFAELERQLVSTSPFPIYSAITLRNARDRCQRLGKTYDLFEIHTFKQTGSLVLESESAAFSSYLCLCFVMQFSDCSSFECAIQEIKLVVFRHAV